VSWLAIRGARVRQDSGNAADNCLISLSLAARWATSILAATNKCLAKSNKSQTGVKATKKRPDGSRRIDETADYGETDKAA
jgi:hypothetical protein